MQTTRHLRSRYIRPTTSLIGLAGAAMTILGIATMQPALGYAGAIVFTIAAAVSTALCLQPGGYPQRPQATGLENEDEDPNDSNLTPKTRTRIAHLSDLAQEKGIQVNQNSIMQLEHFLSNWQNKLTPALVLTDEGHLQAIWQSEDNLTRTTMSFQGDDTVTIVTRRPISNAQKDDCQAHTISLEDLHQQAHQSAITALEQLGNLPASHQQAQQQQHPPT